jgi:glycosidase
VIKKGKSSKYWDWFFIYDEPVIETPYPNYETFANGVSIMPKLNTQNPEVVAYLLNVARYWIEEADIDGWRLDVANEVDQAFWRQFRKVVKESKKDALIIGEVFHNSNPWLQGDQFDAVMNYIFRDSLYDFFAKGKIGVSQFHERLTQLQMMYKDQAHLGMFNLIGSHDTERFLTACGEKEERMKLAVLFQMTYTGMPMIYYGDEIGMVGQNDPDCRRTFTWEEEKQNHVLLDWYKRLIKIRKQNHALTHGSFRAWAVEETKQVYGMVRGIELPEPVGILLNNSPMKHELLLNVPWKREGSLIDALTGQEWRIDDHSLQISLMPYQGVILLHK